MRASADKGFILKYKPQLKSRREFKLIKKLAGLLNLQLGLLHTLNSSYSTLKN